jgi:hypothetical protein
MTLTCHEKGEYVMTHPRESVRWVPAALLAICVMALLARPAPALSQSEVTVESLNGGGGKSQSARFVIDDSFSQGPVGPLASGGGLNMLDGFWAGAALPIKEDTLPPAAVAVFTAGPGDEKVKLRWTNPGDSDFAKTVIRYSTSGYPGSPVGGSPVENGAGGAFSGAAASVDSFLHTDLANQTTYFYTAFAFDSSANYSSGTIASAMPFDDQPPLAVAQFTASGSDTTVILRWTNPDDEDFDHTLIRYSTSGFPAGPADGAAVENGNNGEFENAAASVDSFIHTGLDNDYVYYYAAFAGDEVPNYASPLTASADPEDEDAPSDITGFTAEGADTTVVLRWTNPADADFHHALIRYSTSEYPSDPGDGLPVDNGAGGEFPNAPASADSFVHAGLTNGATYYYAAFAGDEVPNYSDAVVTSATPEDTVPPAPLVSFQATARADGTVKLRWTTPDDGDIEGVHVRYSLTSYPADEGDGQYVDNGSGGMFDAVPAAVDSFIHTGLAVGSVYYYAAFAYDEASNFSPGLTSSAAPYDEVAPNFDISVFQNPYLSNHLDVFVIPSEAIFDTSLVLVAAASDTLDLVVTDSGEGVFRGDYDIYTTGALPLRASGRDVNGNWGWTERSFASSFVLAGSGGVARSLDGLCELRMPGSAIGEDMYILVWEGPGDDGRAIYNFSPAATLEDHAEVSISFGEDVSAPEHLFVARTDGGVPMPVDCYLVAGEHRVVAHVDRLGSFTLLWRQDIDTPVYGTGDLSVFQNIPNPFVGRTTIAFEMPRRGHVKVDIISVDGRIIRSLFDDTVLPGRHTVDWDGCDSAGSRVASGVYLYRVGADAREVTKKMILLR